MDGATMALYLTGRFDLHSRLRIANGSGTLIDYSARRTAWAWDMPTPDAPIDTLRLELLREIKSDLTDSLAPFVQPSLLNRLNDGVTYSPALEIGRLVTFDVALTAERAARPADGSALWYEVFRGITGPPDLSTRRVPSTISLRCTRLEGALLMLAKSEAEHVYPAGTAVEDAAAEVMANNGRPELELEVPDPTLRVLSENYGPGLQRNAWEQVWSLAQSIGYVAWVRYRADGTSALYFFTPAREKLTSDQTIAKVYDFQAFSVADLPLPLNVGYAQYSDSSGVRRNAGPLIDAVSILKYGQAGGVNGIRRPFWISFAPDSPVRNEDEALEVLEMAVADVADPDVVATARLWPLVFAEPGVDRYTFTADPRFFSEDLLLAPYNITIQEQAGNRPESIAGWRGRPSAGYRTWAGLRSTAVTDPAAYGLTIRVEPSLETDTHYAVTWTAGAAVDEVWTAALLFDGEEDAEKWDSVSLAARPDSSTALYVPKPAAGQVALAQVEARHLAADGRMLADVVRRRPFYAAPAEPPIADTDVMEADGVGTAFWREQVRGVEVVGRQVWSKSGDAPEVGPLAPLRGPGDTSRLYGRTLATDEYEHDVELDATRISTIRPFLTLSTGEVVPVPIPTFDRDRVPTLGLVRVDGTVIEAPADSDTRSIRMRHVGGTWESHTDGWTARVDVSSLGTNAVAGIGSTDTWSVEVEALAEPVAATMADTPRDSTVVVVQGATAGGEPAWEAPTPLVVAPDLGDFEVSISLEASSAPGGYTVVVEEWHKAGSLPWTPPVDVTGDFSPALTIPPTTLTAYTWSAGPDYTRFSSGDLYQQKLRFKILDGSSNIKASVERTVSWYVDEAL